MANTFPIGYRQSGGWACVWRMSSLNRSYFNPIALVRNRKSDIVLNKSEVPAVCNNNDALESMPPSPRLFSVILPVTIALAAFLYSKHGSTVVELLAPSSVVNSPSSPSYPSWNTWFDPVRYRSNRDSQRQRETGWNILYHLGGNGPWIEKIDGDSELQGIAPPEGCSVDQVHLVRHWQISASYSGIRAN